jgi:hypothetical protein
MTKAMFEFAADGSRKVKVNYTTDKSDKAETVEGSKSLKYS